MGDYGTDGSVAARFALRRLCDVALPPSALVAILFGESGPGALNALLKGLAYTPPHYEMHLAGGTRFGPYDVLSPLDAGPSTRGRTRS